MSEKIERQIASYIAVAPDGREYTVIESQDFIDATSMGSPGKEWIAGLKHWKLDDGQPVNYVDANTFKIVSTDELIRKV